MGPGLGKATSVPRGAAKRRAEGRCKGARVLVRLILLATALLGAGQASAATLTRGPYLQLLTTTSVTVVWNTDTATTCSLEIRALDNSTSSVIAGATDTVCVIPVEGLTPGRQYAYVPLAGEIPLRSESIFRTDHPTLPYTFLVLGDHGYMPPRPPQLAVATRMLESPADFMLSAGDMIHPEALPE